MEKKSLKRGLSQEEEPFLEAIKEYVASSPIPFDVPGHNMGRLETDFSDFVGREVYVADVNAPIGLDNLYHPKDVIKKTEKLIAEAFNADEALISVNGTTGGIMTMINALLCAKRRLSCHVTFINLLLTLLFFLVLIQFSSSQMSMRIPVLLTVSALKNMLKRWMRI